MPKHHFRFTNQPLKLHHCPSCGRKLVRKAGTFTTYYCEGCDISIYPNRKNGLKSYLAPHYTKGWKEALLFSGELATPFIMLLFRFLH